MELRIKPLVWTRRLDEENGEEIYRCQELDLLYFVWRDQNNEWLCINGSAASRVQCDSLEHGKQLCQDHWESDAGIGRYLEMIE